VTSRIDSAIKADMRIVDLEGPAPYLSLALAWCRDDPSPLLQTVRGLALREVSYDCRL